MKKTAVCAIILVAAACALFLIPVMVCAAVPKPIPGIPPPAIPYYPGGQVELEISLGQDDLAPLIGQYLGKILQPSPEEKSSTEQIAAEAFAKVKGVFLLQMSVPKPVDPRQVVGFYSRIPDAKKMKRLARESGEKGNTSLLWSGPAGDGVFAFRMVESQEDTGKWSLLVVKIDGVLNFAQLLQIKPLQRMLETKFGWTGDLPATKG